MAHRVLQTTTFLRSIGEILSRKNSPELLTSTLILCLCLICLISLFDRSSGKLRARKLNNVQPNLVEVVEYPLIFKAAGKAPYFQKREEWRITDVLKNPMVCHACIRVQCGFMLGNTRAMHSLLENGS